MKVKYAFRKTTEASPDRTISNILFWTWPIHVYHGGKRRTTTPRLSRAPFGSNDSPSMVIRTRRFKGKTYNDVPLSNVVVVAWFGWLWGWRVD